VAKGKVDLAVASGSLNNSSRGVFVQGLLSAEGLDSLRWSESWSMFFTEQAFG